MTMAELTLIVRITAKPGRAVELESALRDVVAPTHAEPGCIRFALHRLAGNPNVYLLVERWTSKQALEEHLDQPYLKRLLANLQEIAEPSEVAEYEMLSAGDTKKLI
jgi:quinol monooxygenase YgiN